MKRAAWTHSLAGAVRQDLGDVRGAIADFTKAVEFEPGYAEAYANRGLAYLVQGNEPQANQDFQRALSIKDELKIAIEERTQQIKAWRAPKGNERRKQH